MLPDQCKHGTSPPVVSRLESKEQAPRHGRLMQTYKTVCLPTAQDPEAVCRVHNEESNQNHGERNEAAAVHGLGPESAIDEIRQGENGRNHSNESSPGSTLCCAHAVTPVQCDLTRLDCRRCHRIAFSAMTIDWPTSGPLGSPLGLRSVQRLSEKISVERERVPSVTLLVGFSPSSCPWRVRRRVYRGSGSSG